MHNIPLSLYVHFPWCVKKCPYCDFNSHAANDIPEAQYLAALIADLKQEMETETRRELHSIFIGGGTPSLISPETMNSFLRFVGDNFDTDNIEITIEANPGTFDQAHFDGYVEAGINRISIGAQSFDHQSLQALGRVHEPDDIEKAFQGARQAGFRRINLDLMHGLPGQSVELAMIDLDKVISLDPEHISWYQLTIEPNTVFYRYPPKLPVDDELDTIVERGMAKLGTADYEQYEVSAYARPGEESEHNLNYWQFGDYLGIGAGAHGKATREGQIARTSKTRIPTNYMGLPKKTVRTVDEEELVVEFLLNALRLNRGFNLALFADRTGLPEKQLASFIDRGVSAGFLESETDERIVPTEKGRLFLTDLLLLA